jgi:hypothetical protein
MGFAREACPENFGGWLKAAKAITPYLMSPKKGRCSRSEKAEI